MWPHIVNFIPSRRVYYFPPYLGRAFGLSRFGVIVNSACMNDLLCHLRNAGNRENKKRTQKQERMGETQRTRKPESGCSVQLDANNDMDILSRADKTILKKRTLWNDVHHHLQSLLKGYPSTPVLCRRKHKQINTTEQSAQK